MKKVMLFGATGRVGREIMAAKERCGVWELVQVSRCVDLADRDKVRLMVRDVCPDVILNLAAYTDVDGAERERENSAGDRALAVNTTGVRNLGIACAEMRQKPLVVHVSTDHVFPGTLVGTGYNEKYRPEPVNWYGHTKLMGEVALKTACEAAEVPYLIVRTSWVFGRYRPSFVETVLKLAMKYDDPVYVVNDQFGTPTCAEDLAWRLSWLIDHDWRGLVHVSGPDGVSRCQFADMVMHEARMVTGLDRFDVHRIKPVSTQDRSPLSAPRPRNSSLCSVHDARMPQWRSLQAALANHMEHLMEQGFFREVINDSGRHTDQ